jgi:hypothetical protein
MYCPFHLLTNGIQNRLERIDELPFQHVLQSVRFMRSVLFREGRVRPATGLPVARLVHAVHV